MTCPPRNKIEEVVLNYIRPTRIQLRLLNNLYRWIRGILEGCLRERGLEAVIESVGSFAKGTLLRDKAEIDVFVLIRNVDDEWIKSEAEGLLRACLAPRVPLLVKYSQHPYVTVELMGLEADIVPALLVDRPRRKGLGVERTPFHTRYVLSRLTACQRDEVRLLKSFLKGLGVYGAEAHVRGFSGYLAELLVITYGSFREVLKEASKWKPPIYVDPEGLGDPQVLARRYPESPLIVVDPVDPERNAAAAVSLESLSTFITAARLYLERPSKTFFHVFQGPPRRPAPGISVIAECIGDYDSMPPEIVWSKARRAAETLYREARRAGFHIARYWFWTDEASRTELGLLAEAGVLPEYEYVEGPAPWEGQGRPERFIEKRLSRGEPVWISHTGRLAGMRRRRWTRLDDFVVDWLERVGKGILRARECEVRVEQCMRELGGDPAWQRLPGWSLRARWLGRSAPSRLLSEAPMPGRMAGSRGLTRRLRVPFKGRAMGTGKGPCIHSTSGLQERLRRGSN